MEVRDTFVFANGTTVFMGPMETQAKFVGPCECELVNNGEVQVSFGIDGEMFPCPSAPEERPPYRAISTRESIDLAAIGVDRGGFSIRSKT